MDGLVLIICAGSTWFMTGVIWFVQVVHYPLFARVGGSRFRDYHAAHTRLTTRVVMAPMILELLTSAILAVHPPVGLNSHLVRAGLLAAAICWTSTGLIQVPLHGRLAAGDDATSRRTLVMSNWIRTVAWTCHAGIVAGLLHEAIATGPGRP